MPEDTPLQPTIANPFATPAQTEPTINNPFAKGVNARSRTWAQPPIGMVRKTALRPIPTTATVQEDQPVQTEPQPVKPSFYISKVSERMLAEVSQTDLPEILQLAKLTGETFSRISPTASDVELAIKIKTFATLRNIAEGKENFDFVFGRAQEQMNKTQRAVFWKRFAESALQIHTDSVAV